MLGKQGATAWSGSGASATHLLGSENMAGHLRATGDCHDTCRCVHHGQYDTPLHCHRCCYGDIHWVAHGLLRNGQAAGCACKRHAAVYLLATGDT